MSSAPFVILDALPLDLRINGRSTLWKRSCQERGKNVTKLHTFLSLWIFFVCVGSSDENNLLIKVWTERDKGPRMWSLALDLPKFKMFSGEDKRCRLVTRCWSFIVINHGVVHWHDPFWEVIFEFELILLPLLKNVFIIIPPAPKLQITSNNMVSSSPLQPLGASGFKKCTVCRITMLLRQFLAIFWGVSYDRFSKSWITKVLSLAALQVCWTGLIIVHF